MIFDTRISELGEGPLWQAERQMLWWFDILNGRLHGQGGDGSITFEFPEMVSAMGLVHRDIAVIAGESGLWRVNLNDGGHRLFVRIEAGQPETRSNDGRADRQGGFWWGTMGMRGGEDPGKGAIWRWYRGETRPVVRRRDHSQRDLLFSGRHAGLFRRYGDEKGDARGSGCRGLDESADARERIDEAG